VFGATKAGKFDSSAATTAPAVEDASLKPKTTPAQPAASSSSQKPRGNGDDIRGAEDAMVIESTMPEKKPPATALVVTDDDSGEEPDTEDDEPAADQAGLSSADQIPGELARARQLVITSFSWGSYGAAEEAILRARAAAEKVRQVSSLQHM
jgi:hypothetical protein